MGGDGRARARVLGLLKYPRARWRDVVADGAP